MHGISARAHTGGQQIDSVLAGLIGLVSLGECTMGTKMPLGIGTYTKRLRAAWIRTRVSCGNGVNNRQEILERRRTSDVVVAVHMRS